MDEVDEVTDRINESLKTGELYNIVDFVRDESYYKYLYLMTKDYINDVRFTGNVNERLATEFDNIDSVNELIKYLTLDEVIFLFSLVENKIFVVYRIIIQTYFGSRRKSVDLIGEIVGRNIVKSKDIMNYLIKYDSQNTMTIFLYQIFPNPIDVKEVINTNKNISRIMSMIMNTYMEEVVLNQI